MTHRAYLVGTAALLGGLLGSLAGGCGSSVTVAPEGVAGSGGEGGYIFLDAGTGGPPSDAQPVQDALPDYEDPGCPDQPPPIEDFACDPYDQDNGDCPPGEGCYIYVEYPYEPCGQEVYGSYCHLPGGGQQGDVCNGGMDCAVSHVCVITGSGTQCVQLCPLTGDDGCPSGMVCEPIDVEGFGGCL